MITEVKQHWGQLVVGWVTPIQVQLAAVAELTLGQGEGPWARGEGHIYLVRPVQKSAAQYKHIYIYIYIYSGISI